MLDAGPPAHEGLAAYNGPILCDKIAARFGKVWLAPAPTAIRSCTGWDTPT